MDISDIPQAQMEKLAAIVTDTVVIGNLTPTSHLRSILAGVKCPWLELDDMELSEENTQDLVTAMREKVEEVALWENITLDIEQLTKYDGGRCRVLRVRGVTRTRHRDRLRRWTADMGWTVTRDSEWGLDM